MNELNLKGSPSIGLISGILSLFIGFAAVAFFGATAPVIKSAMSLTPMQVGLLVAIPTLTGGLLRIPFGAWADSNGGKKPALILLLLSLSGLGSFAVLASIYPTGAMPKSLYPLLLFCGALTGCGVATFTSGIAHVSYWFSKSHQGEALGLCGGWGGLSSGLLTMIIPVGLLFIGFRNVYILWFLFVLIGTIVLLLISHDAYYFQLVKRGVKPDDAKKIASELGQEEFPCGKLKVSLKHAVKNGRCWALTIIYFSTFGGSLALTSWLPSFWTAHYGLSLTTAGILTGASSMFSPIMRIFGGKFADKFGGEMISVIALTCSFFGGLILSFSTSVFIAALGIFIMVAGIGVSNGSIFRLVPVYVPGAVGGASGIIGGVGAMGGFIIPPVLGFAVTAIGEDGYSKGFLLFSALFSICVVVMLILNKIKAGAGKN